MHLEHWSFRLPQQFAQLVASLAFLPGSMEVLAIPLSAWMFLIESVCLMLQNCCRPANPCTRMAATLGLLQCAGSTCCIVLS